MSSKDAKKAKPNFDLLKGYGSVIVDSIRSNSVKRSPALELVGPRLPRRSKVVVSWEEAPCLVQFYKNRINDDLAILNKLLKCLAAETEFPASEYSIVLVQPRAKDRGEANDSIDSISVKPSQQE